MEAQKFKRSYLLNEVEFWHSVKSVDTPAMSTLIWAWHEKMTSDPPYRLKVGYSFECLSPLLNYNHIYAFSTVFWMSVISFNKWTKPLYIFMDSYSNMIHFPSPFQIHLHYFSKSALFPFLLGCLPNLHSTQRALPSNFIYFTALGLVFV